MSNNKNRKQSAEQIVAALAAKGYTPAQVVNSVARSLAHQEKHGSAVKKATFRKADAIAKANLTNAYAAAGPGKIPCDPRCMDAHEDVCTCLCSGVNHGVSLAHA